MTRILANTLKTTAVAGALGLAGAAMSVTPAAAHYTRTRCYGDHCQVMRCDDDGDTCYRIRSYYRDEDAWHHHHHRRWVCEDDGDDCHWVYDGRPSFGISLGFGD